MSIWIHPPFVFLFTKLETPAGHCSLWGWVLLRWILLVGGGGDIVEWIQRNPNQEPCLRPDKNNLRVWGWTTIPPVNHLCHLHFQYRHLQFVLASTVQLNRRAVPIPLYILGAPEGLLLLLLLSAQCFLFWSFRCTVKTRLLQRWATNY